MEIIVYSTERMGFISKWNMFFCFQNEQRDISESMIFAVILTTNTSKKLTYKRGVYKMCLYWNSLVLRIGTV